MQPNFQPPLEQLRMMPLDRVRVRIGHAHHELENAKLASLQQSFIRLPYSLEPSALILFDEVSLSLQAFVRQLLRHYILEAEILYPDSSSSTEQPLEIVTADRLRLEHNALQASLGDLQSLASEFRGVSQSPRVLHFNTLLDELAHSLHEQIREENGILFPRMLRS